MQQAVRKVVVIGPESTGKSTLCEALAATLGVPWVPEHARKFLESLGREYREEDLLSIAAGQLREEDRLAAVATGGLLLCDTDLHVVRVWSEERYGRCNRRILEAIAERNYDAYLLTFPDLPWTPDPQREHPDPADRRRLWHHYHDAVQQSAPPWLDLRGDHPARLRAALNFIGTLFNQDFQD